MVVALVAPELPKDCAFASPEYKQIIGRLRKFQAMPRPANWAEIVPWEMGMVHAFMLDMFERMYAFADYAVEHKDLDNYLGFADIALGHIHNHHHFEEEILFPMMEKACHDTSARLTKNVEQHAVFASQLSAAWLYVRECRAALVPTPKASPVPPPGADETVIDPAEWGLDPKLGFQPAAFRAEMDKWLVPLTMHLDEEIATLEPGWIEQMGEKEFMRQRKVLEKYLQSYDPAWFLVSCVGSMPNDTASRLVPIPMPVRKVLLPLLWAPKYSGYWKYLSRPENLNFW